MIQESKGKVDLLQARVSLHLCYLGGCGQHVVEGILETGKYDVVVLSRKVKHSLTHIATTNLPPRPNLTVRAVDYASPISIQQALQGVDTLISTLIGENFKEVQLALISGCKAAGVRRFAPSEWAGDTEKNRIIDLYRPKNEIIEALDNTEGLEWTLFTPGIFMNYLATPHTTSHLPPLKFLIDAENNTALIPGTGTEPIIYTTAQDVGRFVAATLSLPHWPRKSAMAGSVTTFNEIIDALEKVKGVKFERDYRSKEVLEREVEEAREDVMKRFYAQVALALVVNGEQFAFETNLNGLFPEIRPTGVEEFVRTWWGKKSE
ncbi:NAD-P-binding protein [Fimicolochytrium jonesii]|uniref:NAD-P-binding protein n=1 Tax=Fimicolochytrium jonesii TaxID=1396493 RepID=UPI0022FE5983|nr:NAD-P-binding protein [Fimicolochytrium jonesii]KAI8818012.1 NAD-P-binding protein [Fimicolochytrium jonesii]